MKKIILSIFVLLPFYIVSQELNEAYLASLPEQVRLDVEDKIKAREMSEEPVYRRASSMIDKEEAVISDRFGSNIFDMMQSSFMPIKSTGRASLTNSFSNETASLTISSNCDWGTLLGIRDKSDISLLVNVLLLNLSLNVLNISAEKLKCIPSSLAIQSLDKAKPGRRPLFLK